MPSTSPSFERAWTHYAELDGLKRSTRRLSWPQWVIVARVHGEAVLEAAVATFIRDPKARETAARCGAPGFQVWLRQGRYEHYLSVGEPAPVAKPATRTVPDEIFNAVSRRWGADYATSWLSGAKMSQSHPGTLITATGISADRLARECKTVLGAVGVNRIVGVRDGQKLADYRF